MNKLIAAIGIIIIISCSNGSDKTNRDLNIRNYFYPLKTEKVIYKYESRFGDKIRTGYECIWTDFYDSDTILTRQFFSADYGKIFTHKYKIDNYGVYFVEGVFHKTRSANSDTLVNIKIDTILIWDNNSKPYTLHFENDGVDSYRKRDFKGADNHTSHNDKTYKTIKFQDNMWRTKQGDKVHEMTRTIEFAFGIGPVVEISAYQDGKKGIMEFVEIIEYDKWLNNKYNGL